MRKYIRRVNRTTVAACACPRGTRERARIDFWSLRGRLRARFVNLDVLANEGNGRRREKRIKRFREKREKRFPSHFAECHGQKCRAFTKREMRRREGHRDGSVAFQNPLTPLNAAVAREKKQALYVCMYRCVKNTEEKPTYEQWDLKEIVL